jgi:hypothetical protein
MARAVAIVATGIIAAVAFATPASAAMDMVGLYQHIDYQGGSNYSGLINPTYHDERFSNSYPLGDAVSSLYNYSNYWIYFCTDHYYGGEQYFVRPEFGGNLSSYWNDRFSSHAPYTI